MNIQLPGGRLLTPGDARRGPRPVDTCAPDVAGTIPARGVLAIDAPWEQVDREDLEWLVHDDDNPEPRSPTWSRSSWRPNAS